MSDGVRRPASRWDGEYRRLGPIWGDGPSELIRETMPLLQREARRDSRLTVLDIGCGYGRDAALLASRLPVRVLAVDPSRVGIEMARRRLPAGAEVEFRPAGFVDIGDAEGPFDVIVVAALYHLLEPPQRTGLRAVVEERLAPEGLFLLSTLSVNDPQHAGSGAPVAGEENSFLERVYLHLSTEGELRRDFGFLEVVELREVVAEERRSDGVVHDHLWWVLAARRRRGCQA